MLADALLRKQSKIQATYKNAHMLAKQMLMDKQTDFERSVVVSGCVLTCGSKKIGVQEVRNGVEDLLVFRLGPNRHVARNIINSLCCENVPDCTEVRGKCPAESNMI